MPAIIIIGIILLFLFTSIKIVRQSEVYIIERLGKFHKVADAGLTIIIPFIDHVRSIVSLKQQTLDIAPQEVITKDNVTITINTVVFYKIKDPAKAVYEIQNLKNGIEYLSVTSIRDIVGKMDLQDITPPPDIREAMEKQMNAERTKRASILQAEGERQAAILKAQGEKEAAILHADADREAQIRKANGEAEAIKKVAAAKAEEVKLVYGAMVEANPTDKVIQLKSLETLANVANGEANKVFIPFEATKPLAGLGAMTEMLKDGKQNTNNENNN